MADITDHYGTQIRRDLLEHVVRLIDPDEPDGAGVDRARKMIAEAGIKPNVHVGGDPDGFTEAMTYEWILGQFADVIDNKSWFAMNSGLNVAHHQLDKYGPRP